MPPIASHNHRARHEKKGPKGVSPATGAGTGALQIPTGASHLSLGTQTLGLSPASVGSSSTSSIWGPLLQTLMRKSALSGLAADKLGLATLFLAGSTLVVGLSLWVGSGTFFSSGPTRSSFLFQGENGRGGSTSADGPRTAASSLDYVAGANRVSEPEPELGPQEASSTPQTAPILEVPAPAKIQEPAKEKPQMKKAPGSIQGNGSLSSKMALTNLQDIRTGIGNKFQAVYKAPPAQPTDAFRSQYAPRYAAASRFMSVPVASGNTAFQQAKFAGRLSRQGAAMASANAASATAALPFDAANNAGRINAIGETGPLGNFTANAALDNKALSTPPAPEKAKKNKNETPYQNLIYAGVAALLIGTMLVQIAGKLVQQARQDPMNAAQLLAAAQALAVAAAGAGGTAIGLGAMIADKHGQITQGMPFIIGGAVIIAKAAEVIIKAMQAGQEAEQGVNNAAGDASNESSNMLQGLQGLGSGLDNKPEEEKQEKKPPDLRKGPHNPPPPRGGTWYDPG